MAPSVSGAAVGGSRFPASGLRPSAKHAMSPRAIRGPPQRMVSASASLGGDRSPPGANVDGCPSPGVPIRTARGHVATAGHGAGAVLQGGYSNGNSLPSSAQAPVALQQGRSSLGSRAAGSLGDLLKEGLLEKLSPSAFRGWQLRAFRLYESALLFSEPGSWNPRIRQRILLQHIETVHASASGNLFHITVNNGRVYRLRAGTPNDTRSWFVAVQQACDALQQGLDAVPLMRRSLGLWAEAIQCSTYGQARVVAYEEGQKMLEPQDALQSWHRKCRIMCSLMPACSEVNHILELIDAGMDVACLNLSRGEHAEHRLLLQRIREAVKQRPDHHLAILAEVSSPDIRTSEFRQDVGKTVDLIRGQNLKLVTEYGFKGDRWTIGISYRRLCETVKIGSVILLSDGALALRVRAVGSTDVVTEVMNDFSLGENESVRFPGLHVDLPILEEKGIFDLLDFVIPEDIDFVAISCVQTADDVRKVRKVLGAEGRHINVISKIENVFGLRSFDSILDEGDGIIVARWGLSMEIPPESVALAQKMMIAKGNVSGKISIVATQLLESMAIVPQVSHAEAVDVANGIFDGADCLWLSADMSSFVPVEAIRMTHKICTRSEICLDYKDLYRSTSCGVRGQLGSISTMEATCASAVGIANDSGSHLLITVTGSGTPAFLLAKYRPRALILAVTENQGTCRHLQCVRGVHSLLDPTCGLDTNAAIWKALDYARSCGMVVPGDLVTVSYMQYDGPVANDGSGSDPGPWPVPVPALGRSWSMMAQSLRCAQFPGQSNFLKVLRVSDDSGKCEASLASDVEATQAVASSKSVLADSLVYYGQARIVVELDAARLCQLNMPTVPAWMRKCRVACKLPANADVDSLVQMIDGGMSAAFIHVSHADPAPHQAQLLLLQQALEKRPAQSVALLLDVSGREIARQSLQPQISGQSLSYAVEVALESGADFAVLPVQSVDDVRRVRQYLGERASNLKLLAQIEDQAGMVNFDDIIGEVDGVVLEQGAVDANIPPEAAAVFQKILIGKCNARGKLSLLAGHPLRSMDAAPQPTTVEASGLANAILDGIDCVMLSGETSTCSFSVDAVTAAGRICRKVESSMDYTSVQQRLNVDCIGFSPLEAACLAAVKMSFEVRSRLLLAVSETAEMGLQLAAYRPCAPILAVTGCEKTARHLQLSRGVLAMVLDSESWFDPDAVLSTALASAREDGLAVTGDSVIVVFGESPTAVELQCVNVIKMFTLE